MASLQGRLGRLERAAGGARRGQLLHALAVTRGRPECERAGVVLTIRSGVVEVPRGTDGAAALDDLQARLKGPDADAMDAVIAGWLADYRGKWTDKIGPRQR